ncbi:CPBP family intramembrane glutamic endopeptidase [Planococcus salinus]|uniref:CPBP family intramembrane metalloprotease n=1 Tax=Planococcus salinus TaxID=1848460 RepID=A0A3M8PBQ4_9BACL|nr:CPBP family intramembrane glutamic endopeptidase [Planococcus salinus]RNF41145.1 CPBP family intramembrane metalloprotease [Planococcus salinus]
MDSQMMVSVILLIALAEVFLVVLLVFWKRGIITENPFALTLKKEWQILFYAFFRWKRRNGNSIEGTQAFSYYKTSNYFWLFVALIHEQVLEMVVFHIYLKNEEPEIATIMLVLHIYSVFYMMGDYNLIRNSPVLLNGNQVQFKIGARRQLDFCISDIENIQPATIKYKNNGGIIHEKDAFHVTAMPRILTYIFEVTDEASYEIVFKTPLHARGYFGQKKTVRKALLYIDQPEEFTGVLQEKMNTYSHHSNTLEEVVQKDEKVPVIDWKIYFSLLFLNLLGAVAIAPYAIARENMHQQMGLTEMEFVLYYLAQVFLESAVLLFVALWLIKKVELGVPVIESVFHKEKQVSHLSRKLINSVLYGFLTGSVIIFVSLLISTPLGIDNSSIKDTPWWLAVFGSFGAAVNEESVFRLFLVTTFIWLSMKITKKETNGLNKWTAISLAALIFSGMHYSVAAANFEMTLGVIGGMLLINGIGGMVFGAMFVFMGLEFAIIAHFTANILIQVIGPLFIS